MRVLAAALLALGSTPAAGATLPGWAPGSLAIAGDEAVVTQVGPVTSGALTYHRTDVWRVALAPKGVAGRATRPVTVRTSTGPMRVGPLWGESDGAFALVAPGRRAPGPVVWCCDRETGLQEVLESDGSPNARRPLAVGISGVGDPAVLADDGSRTAVGAPRTAWVAREASRLRLVVRGPRGQVERSLPSVALRNRVAVGGGVVAWITGSPYNAGQELRVDPIAGRPTPDPAAVTPAVLLPWAKGRFALGGVAEGLWVTSNGRADVVATLVREPRRWAVRNTTGFILPVWRSPARPLVAAGGGSLVMLDRGSLLVWRPFGLRPKPAGRIPGAVKSLATDGRRVAWTQWERVGERRRTIVRWRSLV